MLSGRRLTSVRGPRCTRFPDGSDVLLKTLRPTGHRAGSPWRLQGALLTRVSCGSHSSLDFPRGGYDLVHVTPSLVAEDATSLLFFHRKMLSLFLQKSYKKIRHQQKVFQRLVPRGARHTRLLEDVIWKIDLPKDRPRCQMQGEGGGGSGRSPLSQGSVSKA